MLTCSTATFPAQAILFSRIFGAFQMPPSEAVSEGDFYSLMFFIVALGNFAVYAAIGWASNIVAQVGFFRPLDSLLYGTNV
jgi:ATP-binding cassette subfamily B (MDR/TAP) protein 1